MIEGAFVFSQQKKAGLGRDYGKRKMPVKHLSFLYDRGQSKVWTNDGNHRHRSLFPDPPDRRICMLAQKVGPGKGAALASLHPDRWRDATGWSSVRLSTIAPVPWQHPTVRASLRRREIRRRSSPSAARSGYDTARYDQ